MSHTEPSAVTKVTDTTTHLGTTTAFIGLGANLGNAQETLHQAMNVIARLPGVSNLRSSRRYSSAPIDAPGPFYVNAVASVETSLPALELLKALQNIETTFGRERQYRNAPRTLDLDLLLYDKVTINEPTLVVPHPRMHLRAFVLRPLAELVGLDQVVAGQPIRQWLAQCQAQDCSPLD